jgi:hypothetical protein
MNSKATAAIHPTVANSRLVNFDWIHRIFFIPVASIMIKSFYLHLTQKLRVSPDSSEQVNVNKASCIHRLIQ